MLLSAIFITRSPVNPTEHLIHALSSFNRRFVKPNYFETTIIVMYRHGDARDVSVISRDFRYLPRVSPLLRSHRPIVLFVMSKVIHGSTATSPPRSRGPILPHW